MTDEPEVVFRPVYRCSNCGALIDEDMKKCVSCGATFGTYTGIDENRRVKHPEYTEEAVKMMEQCVPNGSAVSEGIGGIGEMVSNHYIKMGDKTTDNALSWKALATGIALLGIEGYAPSILLIHPFQLYDLLSGEADFVGSNEKEYLNVSIRVPSREGVVGSIAGMHVIVSKHMNPGYALMFDDEHFINNGNVTHDAAVLLHGGKSSLYSLS